jgi:PAS domain S-box-containing protein
VLRAIVEGTATATGEDFFRSLVRHFTTALNVRYAFVTECLGLPTTRVRTLAFWTGAGFAENIEYDLAGTPCEQVMDGSICHHPESVQALFPKDPDLVAMETESYLGAPLVDSSGVVIGHLAVLDDKPMFDLPRFKSIFQVFAARAAVELERKRTAEALGKSEERFRNYFKLQSIGIAITSPDKRWTEVNDKLCQILGYPRAELLQKRWTELTHTDDLSGNLELFNRAIAGELDDFALNKRFICKDGSVVYVSLSVRCVRRPDGKIDYFVVVYDDITERKQAERKLHRYQERLRTLASEMSLSEERERRRIAADLHDRTVQNLALSRIKTGALRKSLSSEEGSTILTEIQALIDQTIRDTRSLVFELSPPVLYELGFEPAIEWLTEQMEARHGVTCVVLSDKRPKPLDKDLEVVLFQAVRELLANVGKHAKATRVKVELSRKEDSVHISVGDNGIGFDVNSIGGWGNELGGFGLFSVRERLLLLGGRLEISSAPGSGTKITLVAPLGSGKGK